jgi:hypothetical protein
MSDVPEPLPQTSVIIGFSKVVVQSWGGGVRKPASPGQWAVSAGQTYGGR